MLGNTHLSGVQTIVAPWEGFTKHPLEGVTYEVEIPVCFERLASKAEWLFIWNGIECWLKLTYPVACSKLGKVCFIGSQCIYNDKTALFTELCSLLRQDADNANLPAHHGGEKRLQPFPVLYRMKDMLEHRVECYRQSFLPGKEIVEILPHPVRKLIEHFPKLRLLPEEAFRFFAGCKIRENRFWMLQV